MSKKRQPIKRCAVCKDPIKDLQDAGVRGVTLHYASDFIKQSISLILEEHKGEIPQTVHYKLHQLRKLTDDACLCERCAQRIVIWFAQAKAKAAPQVKLRLDVKDAAPAEHLDRLREGEPELTEGEAKTFRELMKSLRSGDGPAADEV